ncbi:hypothetical protein B5V88_02790 [Heyndrickxia sporothermodurans]|nr:hypothetical protein B5V88_02790 [Heyndrickxia sporothermodurans]PTY86712.1 hypothetical protein B5V91_04635 [Heyndrickxia sporothermodurans]
MDCGTFFMERNIFDKQLYCEAFKNKHGEFQRRRKNEFNQDFKKRALIMMLASMFMPQNKEVK